MSGSLFGPVLPLTLPGLPNGACIPRATSNVALGIAAFLFTALGLHQLREALGAVIGERIA